ncbi:GNAT family N-acetyltransferase [Clostridium estertheticum]|uniref:GNAT family N-acetyltransferase n=1 Tax=Clostridium estertheticum TaxID=238834 RepID=A0AA47I6W0_9CLOT|nr:GNAT family protein [Clostridium estertheticum]MBU3154346.1 GNAT family N-acetyltransferase [Clostridium estertheticum]MBU3197887.1 GNAT family N-acetyltransferase [Clostridium estertheticum]WAG60235.1 GNAT family N-acetyltransferase [Clostridium estertheticum]WAG65687.1 GNAT family N-acetyltransferase [Clostridium estertheticum]
MEDINDLYKVFSDEKVMAYIPEGVTMKLKRIIALAKPENIASNRVIQKIGLKFEYLVSGLPEEFDFYNGEPYYSLTKKEYLEMTK